MNDNTMLIRMNKNKFEYAYELPENYDYEVIESNDKSIIKKTSNLKEKIIKIVVAYGQVKWILNLPENYDYEIIESEEE